MSAHTPVTEAELHAAADGQLTPERQREVEAWLAQRPEEAARVESYRAQKRALHALFDPVGSEAVPERLLRAARAPAPGRRRWRQIAAGLVIGLVGAGLGWSLRGAMPGDPSPARAAAGPPDAGFARRAAIAHAVYAPDQRRPVEVDAAQEDQLVAWLSRRMGAPMKPPRLQSVGYSLEGGRLLPGGRGPVAQFMYRNAAGRRLTLYVSDEEAGAAPARPADAADAQPAGTAGTAFRFVREGDVNVFYWIDGPFGYAIAAEAEREALTSVTSEVHRPHRPDRRAGAAPRAANQPRPRLAEMAKPRRNLGSSPLWYKRWLSATACLGVVDERRLGHAFQEALPFTALLVVFFTVIAVIHDQHLPNGQAAFLFLLTSALAPLIRLSYVRMTLMALPYAVTMTLTGLASVIWLL